MEERVGYGKELALFQFCLLMSLSLAFFVPPAVHGASKQKTPRTGDEFANLGIIKINRAEPAHDFVLSDAQGNSVRLSALRGKVVFLNFWATWCPPCRQEMPSMERLYRQLRGSGLAMLAVNVKESKKEVADFMREFRLSFPALLDTDGSVSRRYGPIGLPATYLIDRTGKLIGHKPGAKNWATAEVIAFFQRLLGAKGAPGFYEEPTVVTLDSPSLPSLLYVKSSDVSIHAHQDRSSETVARALRGERLHLLGKASGGGEAWYMVKTQQGILGWIRLSDVEQQSDAKR